MAEVSKKDSSNGNKTKKSRTELIRAAIGMYLHKQNYVSSDKYRKADLVLSQTTKQFIFSKMIEGDISRSNSFLYSNVLCISSNHAVVEQQFTKFVNFVNGLSDPIKEELSNLFGPLICHLYIELLRGKELKHASEFLRNHAQLIAPVENFNAPLPNKVNGSSVNSNFHDDASFPTPTTQIQFTTASTGSTSKDYFKELIQNLSICLRVEALDANEAVMLFRSSKYEIELSLEALNVLKQYLDNSGHIIILNILYIWVHIDIKDLKDDNEENIFVLEEEVDKHPVLENGIDHKVDIKKEKEVVKVKIEPNGDEETKIAQGKVVKRTTSSYLRRLRHSVMKMNKVELPSRTFKIADPNNQVSCAAMDQNECHLVAGMSNSSVKLWQLDKSTFRGRNLYNKIQNRLCNWNVNASIEQEEEDEDSEEEKIDPQTFTRVPSRNNIKREFWNKKSEENSFNDLGGVILRGHSMGVTDVMFSTNFPLLFTTSKDLTIRAWKASNYTCGAVYRGHNYPIWCINESPVGMYLASGSKDATARLWSIDREFPLITYVGHTQDVECVAFHPNGNYLATGSNDTSVRLWSVTSGKMFRIFTECKFPVASVAFSPDGKLLAAAGDETKIRIFDLAAGSQISELRGHNSSVTDIVWNKAGSKLASCSSDGSIRMWDTTKIGVADSQTPSSSSTSSPSNKVLGRMSGCSRALRVMFNNNTESISCIGCP